MDNLSFDLETRPKPFVFLQKEVTSMPNIELRLKHLNTSLLDKGFDLSVQVQKWRRNIQRFDECDTRYLTNIRK